jgi:hypothetical protein
MIMEYHGCSSYDGLLMRGAVEQCPICPHPHVNIPDDWMNDRHKSLIL